MAKATKTSNKTRLLDIAELLSRKSDANNQFTLKEIKDQLKLNTDRKTFYDDIEALKKYHYDIRYDASTKGYYINDKHFDLYDIKLLIDCLYANTCLPINVYEDLEDKLYDYTNKENKKFIKQSLEIISKPDVENKNFKKIYANIVDAIKNNKVINVKLKDTKNHTVKDRTYWPLALKISGNRYFLYAYDPDKKATRSPRIDNIEDVEITKETFNSPLNNNQIKDWLSQFNSNYINNNIRAIKIIILNENEKESILEQLKYDFVGGTFNGKDTYTVITSLSRHFFGKLIHYGNSIKLEGQGEDFDKYNKLYKSYINEIDKIIEKV